MASLSSKIKEYVNGEVDFTTDVILQNDSDNRGDYIKEWNLDIAQPTQAQLDALDAQADFNVAITNLRAKRNKLLADSDWTQLPDIGFNAAERTAWMNYRQALRDITNNIETAEQAQSINLPAKPQ